MNYSEKFVFLSTEKATTRVHVRARAPVDDTPPLSFEESPLLPSRLHEEEGRSQRRDVTPPPPTQFKFTFSMGPV